MTNAVSILSKPNLSQVSALTQQLLLVEGGQVKRMGLNVLIDNLKTLFADASASSKNTGSAGVGYSITNFINPGETPDINGLDILERAFASTYTDIFIPAEYTFKVSAADSTRFRLVGRRLHGPGRITLLAGNLRLGSGAQVLDGLKIDGNNFTNAGSGVSLLASSSDVVVGGCEISNVQYNGVNINGGCSNVRVINNTIKGCGTTALTAGARSYQGNGVYGSGSVTALTNLRVIGNDISDIYGQGGVMLDTVTTSSVMLNDIRRTFNRGVCFTGKNTGEIRLNKIRECGEVNTVYDAITGLGNGVGCNGIFVNLTLLPEDVVVQQNYIEKVAENGIEGRCLILDNVVKKTGAYPKLVTPSIEGIYIVGEGQAIGNQVYDSAGAGVYLYSTVAAEGFLIENNRVYRPGGVGIRTLAAGVTLTNGLVRGNYIYGKAGDTLAGVSMEIQTNNTGNYVGTRCVANEVFNRSLVQIHSSVARRLNSFDV